MALIGNEVLGDGRWNNGMLTLGRRVRDLSMFFTDKPWLRQREAVAPLGLRYSCALNTPSLRLKDPDFVSSRGCDMFIAIYHICTDSFPHLPSAVDKQP